MTEANAQIKDDDPNSDLVKKSRDVIANIDLFLTVLMILIMAIQCKQMGKVFYYRSNTWFDVAFYSIKIT